MVLVSVGVLLCVVDYAITVVHANVAVAVVGVFADARDVVVDVVAALVVAVVGVANVVGVIVVVDIVRGCYYRCRVSW